MIVRALTLAAGLTGAAGASQFPEFSQQYMQRLGGSVDALEEVVADFDASARAAGLTRADALAQLRGSAFLERRHADMTRTIARAERLSSHLAVLDRAGPFTRAYLAAEATDPEIVRKTLATYKPALPLTFEGLIFAATGFVLSSFVLGGAFAGLRSLFRGVFRSRATPGTAP